MARKRSSEYRFFSHLPEPGVWAGISVVLGLFIGAGLMIFARNYDDQTSNLASMHILWFIPLALLFTFLMACLSFCLGWLVEFSWPLLTIIFILSALLLGVSLLHINGQPIKAYLFSQTTFVEPHA